MLSVGQSENLLSEMMSLSVRGTVFRDTCTDHSLWSSKPITVVGREGGLRPVVSVLKTVCKGVTSSRINASRHS